MSEGHELHDLDKQLASAAYTELSHKESSSNIERDNNELRQLGKKPVLRRNFGFISILGFSCSVMVTWETLLFVLTINYGNGGAAGSIYGYIIVWIGNLCAYATMAELASMAPTAGGQYHWVSMLAPEGQRKFLSYIVGWVTMLGWQALVASGGFVASNAIIGLMTMNDTDFKAESWQTIMLFWATILFAILTNTFISYAIPKIEAFILMLHIMGFFAILIPMVYWAPHGSASDVFLSFANNGGWSSQGLSFMVGMIGPVFALVGADSSVHMSEEIQNASINVPRAMVTSILINGALGFGILIAAMFCLGDVTNVIGTPTGIPAFAIFEQAVGSVGGGLVLASITSVCLIFAAIGWVATASRITWGFARDKGLPGYQWISRIEPRTTIPLVAIGFTAAMSVLLSLILFGSSVAFNDVVSLSVGGLYTTTFICNSLLLYRRLTAPIRAYSAAEDGLRNNFRVDKLTWGPWRIAEPWGTLVNAVGCAYMLVIIFFSFWPSGVGPTPDGMNYSVMILGVVLLLSVVYYAGWARRVYEGPLIEID